MPCFALLLSSDLQFGLTKCPLLFRTLHYDRHPDEILVDQPLAIGYIVEGLPAKDHIESLKRVCSRGRDRLHDRGITLCNMIQIAWK